MGERARDNAFFLDTMFDALEEGDLDKFASVWDSKGILWHNTNLVDQNLAVSLKNLAAYISVISNIKYINREFHILEDGAAGECILTGITPNGTDVYMPMMIRAKVKNNKIVRLNEYIDSVAANVISDAFS